jgi:hypothetical protein
MSLAIPQRHSDLCPRGGRRHGDRRPSGEVRGDCENTQEGPPAIWVGQATAGGSCDRWWSASPLGPKGSRTLCRTPAAFTGGPVAARQYLGACDALVALGLIHQSRSIRYGLLWDDGGPEVFRGKAPRLWPTQALLDTVGRHGLTPATLAEDFGDIYPTQPPAVADTLQVFTLKQRGRAEQGAHPKASARRRQNTHERFTARR